MLINNNLLAIYTPRKLKLLDLGYLPDGYGVTYNYQSVIPGDSAPLDDDLVLWFTKNIS